jgi:hypothetical protein
VDVKTKIKNTYSKGKKEKNLEKVDKITLQSLTFSVGMKNFLWSMVGPKGIFGHSTLRSRKSYHGP